jgi:hypothetical protein
MNRSTFIKRIRTAGRRRTLSALLLIWVGLGVQPCALAAVSESDCPHCPPANESQAMDMHDHCGTDAKLLADASTTSGACCEAAADDGAIEARTTLGKYGDINDASPAPPPAAIPSSREISGTLSDFANPPDRQRSSVPLRILYCVYRD